MTTVAHDVSAHRGFERMYRRHVAAVYRYTSAVLGNQADAEDATQQTFLSAYRSWERGDRPRRDHNWLIAIAHNVCRERFRERSRRPSEVTLDVDTVPARGGEDRIQAVEIKTAIGQLSFNQRAALVMRELEGRSYDEIGASLGVSHAAVETLLFRARRSLREQLEGDLTCGEAERALSQRLDHELSRRDASGLRAHLRACQECATLERSMRARRTAVRGLMFPLPPSLGVVSGASTSAVATGTGGLLAKGAAVVAAGAVAGGVGTQALEQARPAPSPGGSQAYAIQAPVPRNVPSPLRAASGGSTRPEERKAPTSTPGSSLPAETPAGTTASAEAPPPAPGIEAQAVVPAAAASAASLGSGVSGGTGVRPSDGGKWIAEATTTVVSLGSGVLDGSNVQAPDVVKPVADAAAAATAVVEPVAEAAAGAAPVVEAVTAAVPVTVTVPQATLPAPPVAPLPPIDIPIKLTP